MLYKVKKPVFIEAVQINSTEQYDGFEPVCDYEGISRPCDNNYDACKESDCEYQTMHGYINVDGTHYYPVKGQFLVKVPVPKSLSYNVLIMDEDDFNEKFESCI